MEYLGKDKRTQKRAYIEPYDTGTFLEFMWEIRSPERTEARRSNRNGVWHM